MNTGWRSGLSRSETLELALPATPRAARPGVSWSIRSGMWPSRASRPSCRTMCPAPMWVFRFVPRPGEKLASESHATARGEWLDAGDRQRLAAGHRGRALEQTRLTRRRAQHQGGRHVIRLPEDARVTAVLFDDRPQQLRPEKGELPLSLTPGKRTVVVDLGENGGRVVAHATAAARPRHARQQYPVRLAPARFALGTGAPGDGHRPGSAVLGGTRVFIFIAWLLGRWSHSPLRFTEWLLLGLGLSTQSWVVFTVTAIWLLLVRWRERWQPGPRHGFPFQCRAGPARVVHAVRGHDPAVLGHPQRPAGNAGHGHPRSALR